MQVADFGLSKSLDIKTRIQTRTYGTITHQPPETLLHGLVSRETDTYSFGVLLWQMYTGSRPWAGMSHAQVRPYECKHNFSAFTFTQCSGQNCNHHCTVKQAVLNRQCSS